MKVGIIFLGVSVHDVLNSYTCKILINVLSYNKEVCL